MRVNTDAVYNFPCKIGIMHTFQDIYRVELPRTQVNQLDWNQIENIEIIS